MFTYKGYVGRVEIDEEANLLHGSVVNTRDVITFQGESVEEAKQAFHDSVDEYLKFCEENNREPDKPFSGQFMQRISPELHRAATAKAASENTSLNAWVEGLIQRGVEVDTSPGKKASGKRSAARKSTLSRRKPPKHPKGTSSAG